MCGEIARTHLRVITPSSLAQEQGSWDIYILVIGGALLRGVNSLELVSCYVQGQSDLRCCFRDSPQVTCRYLQLGVDNEHEMVKSEAQSILAGKSTTFPTGS